MRVFNTGFIAVVVLRKAQKADLLDFPRATSGSVGGLKARHLGDLLPTQDPRVLKSVKIPEHITPISQTFEEAIACIGWV